MATDDLPTRRFSSRVVDYVKYRPSYPPEIVPHLASLGLLPKEAVIADVGSGTGLLAELFLKAGHAVIGIEPNPDMRAAGDAFLAGFPHFRSIEAPAETTTLPDASVDLILAGQAFHWFDQPRAKQEFRRILSPKLGAGVALIWNERLTNASPFLRAYEELLQQYSLDYTKVDHRQINDQVLADFFAPRPVHLATFPNRQTFDFAGLCGRLLSSSYAPATGHPNHRPMLELLQQLFTSHQQNNQVVFEYETKVYTGLLLT